jgi:molecular chaperone DnaK (HSP70)
LTMLNLLCRCLIFAVLLSQTLAFSAPRVGFRRPTLLASTDDGNENGVGVGIDLGTTNSAIAILQDGIPTIITVHYNGRTMPSVVAFDDLSRPLVGREAMEWEDAHKTSAYRNTKRVVGMGANHLSSETRKAVPHLVPYVSPPENKKKYTKKKKVTLLKQLKDAEENPAMLYSLKKESETRDIMSPTAISSFILQRLLDTATAYTKQKITRAVIGVPAYFNDAQREATKQAAQMAGISKVKLLREPEAAALAYGFDQDSDVEELVLVFDLGGGTYDVSMLLIDGQGLTEIICTAGDAQLGGSNFDVKVAQYFSRMTKGSRSSTNRSNIMVRAAEQVRIYLSNNRHVNLALPLTEVGWNELADISSIMLPGDDESFVVDTNNSTHIFCKLTRKEMEGFCLEEFQALLRPIREVAIMAGALLPGDTRPSLVETALRMEAYTESEDFYDGDQISTGVADEAFLRTIQAEQIELKDIKKAQQNGRKKAREVAKSDRKYRNEERRVIEKSQEEVKVRGDGISGRPIARIVLVGGATRMPGVGRVISALTGVVPQKTVNPDEAVAIGCAVHVGVLDGSEGMGTVLNPMQAAILRAVVEQKRGEGNFDGFFDDDDDDFGDIQTFGNQVD